MSPLPYPASTLRLLSPTRRRICVITTDRAQEDPNLAKCLRNAGWTDYRGPAQINRNGWIIPGTDLAIDRIATPLHQNLRGEWD
jgi:hypothetical protein